MPAGDQASGEAQRRHGERFVVRQDPRQHIRHHQDDPAHTASLSVYARQIPYDMLTELVKTYVLLRHMNRLNMIISSIFLAPMGHEVSRHVVLLRSPACTSRSDVSCIVISTCCFWEALCDFKAQSLWGDEGAFRGKALELL